MVKPGVGVPQPFGHDLDRNARRDFERRAGVAEPVQADARQAEWDHLAVVQRVPRLGVHRNAGVVGEDRIVRPGRVSVSALTSALWSQHALGLGLRIRL